MSPSSFSYLLFPISLSSYSSLSLESHRTLLRLIFFILKWISSVLSWLCHPNIFSFAFENVHSCLDTYLSFNSFSLDINLISSLWQQIVWMIVSVTFLSNIAGDGLQLAKIIRSHVWTEFCLTEDTHLCSECFLNTNKKGLLYWTTSRIVKPKQKKCVFLSKQVKDSKVETHEFSRASFVLHR